MSSTPSARWYSSAVNRRFVGCTSMSGHPGLYSAHADEADAPARCGPEPASGPRLRGPDDGAGVHLPLPHDGPARLRHDPDPLRARPAPGRVEVAQALPVVVSRRGRLPRGRDQPDPRRLRRRRAPALGRGGRRLQRARRHQDRGARHPRQAPGARAGVNDGVFPRAGRYLGSRPTVWLAGIAVNAVILLLQGERELAYLAAAGTGAAAVLLAWALELLLARGRAEADAPPHPALRRLAAVAFAVGGARAL